ncbi:hypothetical protein FQN60_004023 [Etheostoma spectabile]|uniref:Uncharacterized protein n=1 Tax=Etheostoma spectabile TaxID=54343 RepID=A0A5J5CW00_9PERO|nr:hypothetical protein FQN60_004023 [Etheostoma spectabile]
MPVYGHQRADCFNSLVYSSSPASMQVPIVSPFPRPLCMHGDETEFRHSWHHPVTCSSLGMFVNALAWTEYLDKSLLHPDSWRKDAAEPHSQLAYKLSANLQIC